MQWFLEFMFKDPLHFFGILILIAVGGNVLALIIYAFWGKKCECKNNKK